MTQPVGAGEPFTVLKQAISHDEPEHGFSLPPAFQEAYAGDWVIPESDAGCYRYSCFVISHDGKVSFSVPGHEGGGDVSGFNPYDQWIMGLLRARADAVVVGANTLRTESEHKWTCEYIYPSDASAFQSMRSAEGREKTPVQVFITRTGEVPAEAAVLRDPELRVVLATTETGARRIRETLPASSNLEVITAGTRDIDWDDVFRNLRENFGVRTALCEGGPRVYASLLTARQLDEEFLTISPIVVGGSLYDYRPGLVDGIALEPDNSIRRRIVSLRLAGEHLFMRARYDWVK